MKTFTGVPMPKKINTSHNDAVLGVSPDGNSLYVYRGAKNGGDIYVSHFNPKKNDWKKPKPLPRKINSKQSEGSVFFTASGDTMYFISANEDLTQGGKDILYTVKDERGKWQDPHDLGSLVNSRYDEEGIYLSSDGNQLWFSSRGHNSMGGFDIFHTEKMEDGTWSDPENIGYPINTADDDLFFREPVAGKYGYYTTIREGGLGAKDIYKVTFLGSEKELLLSNEDILIAGLKDTTKRGFFTQPEAVQIDSFYYLTGHVLDKETKKPVLAKLEFIDVENSRVVATSISTDSGMYRVRFSEPKNYGVEILAKDYLFFLDAVDMSGASSDIPVVKDFYLEKLQIGTKVVLENIYFETNKATLKPESYEQLDQVVKFMENNESVRLEISGHTDNTGSLKYNTKLSEERAKAVVDYLVSKGIDTSRLTWKGYAFTQPVAPNNTAEGRKKNRRVEFKVIGK
jgi:outer membrane protein OmpA-like peptidoglycan-associated protein